MVALVDDKEDTKCKWRLKDGAVEKKNYYSCSEEEEVKEWERLRKKKRE